MGGGGGTTSGSGESGAGEAMICVSGSGGSLSAGG